MYSQSIEKLTKIFSHFPTVGPRTATRFAFHLIQSSNQEIADLVASIQALKKEIRLCSACFKSFESKNSNSGLCEICSDPRRNQTIICIVEKETDLEAMEKSKQFKGVYFILGGLLTRLSKNEDILKDRLRILREKIAHSPIQEIILALNPTPEGQNTGLWLKRQLAGASGGAKTFSITQLGLGLPIGGEIEYADNETITSAFQGRK